MSGLRISAALVVRNGARFVAQAITSVLAQTRPPDELVVVDGHSTDGTADIVRMFPGVRLVEQAGAGLGEARNQAIAAARGEAIAFIDHDDTWTEDKLARQLPLLAASPAPAAVIAHLRFVAEHDASAVDRRRAAAGPRIGRTPGTLLAHRAAFARAGAFDPARGLGADMEWFVRAGEAGIRFVVAPEVLLLKRLHAGNLSADITENRRAAFGMLSGALARRRAAAKQRHS